MDKTFAAIEKLKEVELELHRLKNALHRTNLALETKREWVGLTDEDVGLVSDEFLDGALWAETKLKEKNT